GFNKFFDEEENAEVISSTPPEGVEVGRQYSTSKVRKPTKTKIDDDRWEVTSPLGESTFYSTEAAAEDAIEDLMADNVALSSITVLAVNSDNSIKVEDSEGNITNIPASIFSDYVKVLSDQEKLQKSKSELDKQQKDLEKESGNNPTSD